MIHDKHKPEFVSADSLIETFGDQAYHKGLRMHFEALRADDIEASRALAQANIELMKRGFHKKPRIVDEPKP